jgi:ActR/RegA family two-component response regulator
MTSAASVATANMAAAAVSGKSVFSATIVGSLSYVAVAVARLIGLEMIEALRTALRKRAVVAVTGIEAIVDVAVEARMAVKPGACTDEDAAHKPVGPIVPVGSAVIRRIVEVSVRANRGDANVDTDLGWSARRGHHESKGKHRNCKELT